MTISRPLHHLTPTPTKHALTIRFLVSSSRTWPTELLRLTSPIVSHQQCPIVLHQGLLQLVLRVLVHIFLVVCDDRLSNGLSACVDLRCVATAGDSYADVHAGELVETDYQEGFVDLYSV